MAAAPQTSVEAATVELDDVFSLKGQEKTALRAFFFFFCGQHWFARLPTGFGKHSSAKRPCGGDTRPNVAPRTDTKQTGG